MINETIENDPIFLDSYLDPCAISLIMALGIFVNWKFVKNMNEDDKNRGMNSNGLLIRDIMATNAKTQIVVWPILWILFWLIQFDTPFPTWMQPMFCYIKLIAYIFRIYFAFNSLAVAAMRYAFIVHNTNITSFGIVKTKTIFYYGSILIPLIFAILYECTFDHLVSSELGGKIGKICKNSHHVNSITANTTSVIKDGFNSPIYALFRQYVPKEVVYYFGISTKICLGIIFGNLLEGVLYWMTFRFISR